MISISKGTLEGGINGPPPNVPIADLGFNAMTFNATTNVVAPSGTVGTPGESISFMIDPADTAPMDFPADGTCGVFGPNG